MRILHDYTGYTKGNVPLPFIVRHRPTNFEDFIGNEDVIEGLRDILREKINAHFFINWSNRLRQDDFSQNHSQRAWMRKTLV